jgi:hypothetical protein
VVTWLAWIAGFGTGASVTVLVKDWRTERRRRAMLEARRTVWAEPLRLFTHDL